MLDIGPYKQDLHKICVDLRVKELLLFGSATRSDFGSSSDLDFIVDFSGKDNLFDRFFELLDRASTLFDRKVDLLTKKSLTNPILKQRALSEAKLIYAA